MAVFVVKKVAGQWAVVNNGIMLASRLSAPEAIETAISTAQNAAKADGSRRVIYEDSAGERRLVWDSEKDGFNAE
jgi:hypothetical protein